MSKKHKKGNGRNQSKNKAKTAGKEEQISREELEELIEELQSSEKKPVDEQKAKENKGLADDRDEEITGEAITDEEAIDDEITDEETNDEETSDGENGTVTKKNESKDLQDDKKNAVIKEIFSWIKVFVVAFVVAFILSNFVIVNARVPSGSMKNTINEGDKVIGFRLSYLFSEPKRGDIVMFYAPDKENTIYIKRLIGLPGDKIVIQDNKLYINGELITENYVKNPWTSNKGTFEFNVIPEGEYFMMGDNRDNSNDSRAWWTVKKNKIIAKAIFRYYPSFTKFK